MKKLLFLLPLLSSCAVVVHPTGGEIDTEAPKAIAVYPDSNATEFSDKEVLIRFDEYFEIADPKAIIISPPLEKEPKIEIIRKTLRIRFNSKLRDSTTYTIQLEGALQDITEKNVLNSYHLSFSTGTQTDTGFITGTVVDNYSGSPAKNYTVALFYPNLSQYQDTSVFPLYITKTRENGKFLIPAIRTGEYSIYAFNDFNNNLRIDFGEELAFCDSIVHSGDTVELRYGMNKPDTKLSAGAVIPLDQNTFKIFIYRPEMGIVGIRSTSPTIQKGQQLFVRTDHPDTLYVADFIKSHTDTSATYYLLHNNLITDTFRVIFPQKTSSASIALLKKQAIVPASPVLFQSNYPIIHFRSDLITLVQSDSINVNFSYRVETVPDSFFHFQLIANAKANQPYSLILDDSAIGYMDGSFHPRDTLPILYQDPDLFGSATILFNNSNNQFIRVELLAESDKEPIQSIQTYSDSVSFQNVPAGSYLIRLVYLQENKSPRLIVPFNRQLSRVYIHPEALLIRGGWKIEAFRLEND